MSVSDLTLTSAFRHWNIRASLAINQRVASSARRGLTLRSWKSASCLRRKRFSAARDLWERIARQTSRTRSKATPEEVRRQCATARASNDTGMNAGSHFTERYQNAIFGRDRLLADDRRV